MKILIIHTYGLGDMIMFTPALQAIVDVYPEAIIDFVVFQKVAAEPIKNLSNTRKVYYASFKINSILKTLGHLRDNRYDIAFVTSGTSPVKSGIFLKFCHAKMKIGECRKGWQKIFFDRAALYKEFQHRVDNNYDLIRTFVPHPKAFPASWFGCEKVAKTKEHSKTKKIGIHVGSNPAFKLRRWPSEYFVELINLLKGYCALEIKIFAGPGEMEESRLVAKATGSEIVTHRSLQDVAKEIASCDIFINTDSGLGHIASCFDLEVFTIFGPAKEYKTSPWSSKAHIITKDMACRPCYGTPRLKNCQTFDCLNLLMPTHVFEKIKKESKVLHECLR